MLDHSLKSPKGTSSRFLHYMGALYSACSYFTPLWPQLKKVASVRLIVHSMRHKCFKIFISIHLPAVKPLFHKTRVNVPGNGSLIFDCDSLKQDSDIRLQLRNNKQYTLIIDKHACTHTHPLVYHQLKKVQLWAWDLHCRNQLLPTEVLNRMWHISKPAKS